MTATTTQHAHETPEQLQRLAYELHHVDKMPWAAVAEELDEPMEVVKDLAQDYIDRTDADAREAQAPLF